ncbi:MAG: CxxC-x17-CxxC domain-containing protein [Candidatus Woesearchaeota archaeon]
MGRFKTRDFSRTSTGRPERFERGQRRKSDLELTSVICAKCGRSCEVPFKPTSNKPVYCRSCFKQAGPGNESTFVPNRYNPRLEVKSAPSSELDKINQKLDKIMRALKID